MLTMMMSRNSAKMNDILSQSNASTTHPHLGHRGSMVPTTEQMVPIVRSMSDASDFLRRSNPVSAMGAFGNFDYSRMEQLLNMSSPTRVMSSSLFASSSSVSDGTESNGSSMFNGANSNQNLSNLPNSSAQVEDEDFDLNMVFDEIGALQNKCLDESEDDIVAPLSQLNSAIQQMQQSQHHKPTQVAQHPQSVSVQTSDGKVITYNPEQYDEADVTLANEKYALNVRYLKDFRCEQCPLFLQHKCTQHKPFTCFHWHFANQRRRRPLRKRDGTFNYSPDVYCNKYDETTGICPDGDDCPHLHRTAGDTERRYHLRYYKTGMCVYETDQRGFCVKNGPHCAFAHGQHDLRLPVFDVREQSQVSDGETDGMMNGHGMYDKDRNAVNEDPRWQDIAFVLANYKTELCKRPPRLCRQGYACPQYHNSKDRRRSPKKFKYRSTPCPSVKQGDEWGDPANCENEDNCTYCHTRTEQQFHPEIYKSTKCNDIQQSNFCPRGPFCAFAHSESSDEINTAREFSTDPSADMPPTMVSKNNTNTSPVDISRANSLSTYNRPSMMQTIPSSLPDHFDSYNNFDLSAPQPPLMNQHELNNSSGTCNNLGPIARPRSFSTSNTKAVQPLPLSALLEKNNLLKGPPSVNNNLGSTLFSAASSTSSLFSGLHEHQPSSSFSSNIMPFYGMPQENVTIDSMLHQMDDLNLDTLEAKLSSLTNSNTNASTSGMENHQIGVDVANSSLSTLNALRRSSLLDDRSAPINIPANRMGPSLGDVRSTSATGFNLSPPPVGPMGTTSPLGSSYGLASSFNGGRHPSGPPPSQSQSFLDSFVANLSTQSGVNGPQPPPSVASANQMSNNSQIAMALEVQRLRDENSLQKNTLINFEDKFSQVLQIYRREINEANKKEKMAEKARDEAIDMLNSTQKELEMLRSNENAFQKRLNSDINSMSRNQLIQLQLKIKQDLNCVEEAIQRSNSM